MKPKKAKPLPAESIEGPAKLRPGHIQDRTLSIVAGAVLGWTNLEGSPIAQAHENGALVAPSEKDKTKKWSPKFNGNVRWLAMRDYAEIHHLAQPGSRDSTNLDIVSGGGGCFIAEAQSDAIKKLIAVKSWMAEKDRIIVQRLAGGWSLAGAVREACGEEFKFSVRARVRDALDSLIQAMESARRNEWRFTMRQDPLDKL